MMLLISSTLLVVFLLIPLLCWYYLTLVKFRALNKIPGPKPLPLLGNALDLGSTPQELFHFFCNLTTKYGKIWKVWLGPEPHVVITSPELSEPILNSTQHITKSSVYDYLRPWIGDGLLVSRASKWKSRRKMITPTFHFTMLNQFVDIFNSAANIMVEKLAKEEAGKESIDFYPYSNFLSLDIICETAMGVQMNSQEHHNLNYFYAVKGFLDIFFVRAFSLWQRFDWLFPLSRHYNENRSYLKTLHTFANEVIHKKRQRESNETEENFKIIDDLEGVRRKKALLDMLLSEKGNRLTDEDIRDEINTFLFEGHDTTMSAVAFGVLCLAENQDVQEKLHAEVVELFGNDVENLTMQQLNDTRYLDMVIKEVLRLYPSVPFIQRTLQKELKMGDYTLPKDTTVTIYIQELHRCAKNFPNPNKFDPDRFMSEKQSSRHNFVHIPFSAGPRNCIGQKFAMLEMKVTMAKMVKKFKILSVPGFKPEMGMAAILKSYNGIYVKLQCREED